MGRKGKRAGAYVVVRGHVPGVYTTWEECEPQIRGFPGNQFRGYPTYEDAMRAWGEEQSRDKEAGQKRPRGISPPSPGQRRGQGQGGSQSRNQSYAHDQSRKDSAKQTEFHVVASGSRPGIYLGKALWDEQVELDNGDGMYFSTTKLAYAVRFLRGGGTDEKTRYHAVFVPALHTGAVFADMDTAQAVCRERPDNRLAPDFDTAQDAGRHLQYLVSEWPGGPERSTSAAPPLDPSPPPLPKTLPPVTRTKTTTENSGVPGLPRPENLFSGFDHDFARRARELGLPPGSAAYVDARTEALELELMVRCVPRDVRRRDGLLRPRDMTEEHRLLAYQDICASVGVVPRGTAEGCAYAFRTQVLVEPTDLVNAMRRRAGRARIHGSWDEFVAYVAAGGRRVSRRAVGPFLAALLHDGPTARADWERERWSWQEGIELRERGTVSLGRECYVRKLSKHTRSVELIGWTAPGERRADDDDDDDDDEEETEDAWELPPAKRRKPKAVYDDGGGGGGGGGRQGRGRVEVVVISSDDEQEPYPPEEAESPESFDHEADTIPV